MKKILTISFVIVLLTTINLVIAPYNVPVDQTFNYDVKNAEVKIILDNNKFSGKGFKIDEVGFNQRTVISVTIDSVTPGNVLWTLSSDGVSSAKLADWALVDEATLSNNILNPFSIIQDFLELPAQATEGLGLIFHPILGTNRTIDFFKQLTNQTHYQYSYFSLIAENIQYDAYYSEDNQLMVFESLISGRLNQSQSSPSFDMTFLHQSQLVYDISIGLLYGSRFKSEGSGIFLNKSAEYTFESHIELKNYNLPRLQFNLNDFQQWWIIGIIGSALIIVIVVYSTKKIK